MSVKVNNVYIATLMAGPKGAGSGAAQAVVFLDCAVDSLKT